MSVPLTLLGLLERGPSYGYDLKRDYHCLAGILVPGEGEVWYGGQRLDSLSQDRVAACADREVVVRDGRVGTLTGAQP